MPLLDYLMSRSRYQDLIGRVRQTVSALYLLPVFHQSIIRVRRRSQALCHCINSTTTGARIA